MPAAAVIPAPIVYNKVVAVKKFVVVFCSGFTVAFTVAVTSKMINESGLTTLRVTLIKIECLKHA